MTRSPEVIRRIRRRRRQLRGEERRKDVDFATYSGLAAITTYVPIGDSELSLEFMDEELRLTDEQPRSVVTG